MGVILSRKYHYLLNTDKGFALTPAQKSEVGHAVTDFKNETEKDLSEWIQQLIRDTENDPAAIRSREQRKLTMGALTGESGKDFAAGFRSVPPKKKPKKDEVVPASSKDTEPAHWQAALPGQKSFLVEVLHWFHFRPQALAKAWTREEVLTWELIRSLKLLPQSMFLRPLLSKVAALSLESEAAIAPLLAAPHVSVCSYPSLELKGSQRNCRSDLGIGLEDNRPTVWFEAKTAPSFKAHDLRKQLDQQRAAMAEIFQSTPTALVTLLPSFHAVPGIPNLSWDEVKQVYEAGVDKLLCVVANDDIRHGYESLAKELIQRILSHPNGIVGEREKGN